MNDKAIQECNQKCRAKYGNFSEKQLIKEILLLQDKKKIAFKDKITQDRLESSYLKEGLLVILCTLECDLIEKGWRD